jgi:hypothetical protein
MSYNPNPGARDRACSEPLADPARSDRLIAQSASCRPTVVFEVWRSLIAAGVIPAGMRRKPRPRPPASRTRIEFVPAWDTGLDPFGRPTAPERLARMTGRRRK